MSNDKVLYLGSDHAGFKAKDALKDHLEAAGYKVIDLGCFSEDPCDYPDIAREVGEKVYESQGSRGILACGSGIGISIAANKMKGIRCALTTTVGMAESARQHNNANVLAMGARVSSIEDIKAMTDAFLGTDFEEDTERHARRVDKMNHLENLA